MSITRRTAIASLAGAAFARATAVQGSVLVHEHILVDFIGAGAISAGRYNPEEVIRVARPKLEELRVLGCVRMLECTPNFLGRDPRLLHRLEDATDLELWTNTGLYAAADHKFLPPYASTETADQLAKRWIIEARRGVDGVKPRFVKIGVNKAPLHALDRKIVEAAAITSKDTGLTVAAHTGDGKAALEELEIFDRAGVPASRFVWVHAQNEKDQSVHEQVARAGAWVEFDGISPDSLDWHVECVSNLAAKDLIGRVLVSQDAGWYHVGEPGGGEFRPYTFIYTGFAAGLSVDWRKALLVDNPRAAFGR